MGDTLVVKVGPKGRSVIPAELRAELDIAEGDELVVVPEGGTLRLVPRARALAGLRGVLAGSAVDVVAELLADRRRAAAADLADHDHTGERR